MTVLLTLLAWTTAQEEEMAPLPPELERLLADGHCVAHELTLPGQGFHLIGSGFHLIGSTGGFVFGDIVYQDPTGTYPDTAVSAQTVRDQIDLTGQPTRTAFFGQPLQENVAIVVADDFAGNVHGLPEGLFLVTSEDDLHSLMTGGGVSHGALVMHHLNVAIASTGTYELVGSEDGVTTWRYGDTDKHLSVVALDLSADPATNETESALIGEQQVYYWLSESLPQTLATLEQERGVNGAVVNMSWVLLPCATVEEFIANRDAYDTVGEYVAGLGLGPEADLGKVWQALGMAQHEGLVALLDEGQGEYPVPVTFVAAAGNFSMPYQMLPADWQRVVGVAVAPVQRPFPGRYSNVGDVVVPGEWTALQALQNGRPATPTELSYAGTSYSSPLVALYLAEDMAGSEFCLQTMPDLPLLTSGTTGTVRPGPADMPLGTAIDACQP